MNSIITLRRLVEIISKGAGTNQAKTEQFVKAFTSVIRDALVERESVTIAGIGTFSVDEKKEIVYEADKELADTINAPFAMFQAEELAPADESGTTYVEVAEEATTIITEGVVDIKEEPQPQVSTEDYFVTEEEVTPTEEEAPRAEARGTEPPATEALAEDQSEEPRAEARGTEARGTEARGTETPGTAPNRLAQTYYTPGDAEEEEAEVYDEEANDEQPQSGFPYFWAAWSLVLGLIIGLCIGFFVHDPIQKALSGENEEQNITADELMDELNAMQQDFLIGDATQETEKEQEEETVEVPAQEATPAVETPASAPAQPAENTQIEAVVYDTLQTNLSVLAQKHYGNKNYWPYIYKENEKLIGDPAKAPKGLKLVIPPKSKYDISTDEAVNLENAKKMGAEINKKYKH